MTALMVDQVQSDAAVPVEELLRRIEHLLEHRLGDGINEITASSIPAFAKRYAIGKRSVWAEIRAGHLTATKIRGRTVILIEDEARWRAALPKRHAEVSDA